MRHKQILLGFAISICWQFSVAQSDLTGQYDVRQYILDLNISNTHSRISGSVTMTAEVIAKTMDTAAIELIDSIGITAYMIVDSARFNGLPASFDHTGWVVKIPLSTPGVQGDLFSLQVFYHGNAAGCPQSLWNGINRKNYQGKVHTYATSQPFYSKFWWPCKDIMTDKADSVTFHITTDSTNITGSNGLLRSVSYPGEGKARYHWETHYPVTPYLISFICGPLTEHIDYAPLASGTDSLLLYNMLFPTSEYYPVHLAAIEKTKDLISLYSSLLGTYPFNQEKYGYSVVGTPVIGMEHQTMCTMGYQSLDTTSTRYYGLLTHFMTAHELAHQWFGDAVICDTWNDAWLVDGMASYMEYVALQTLESQSSADAWMQDAHTEVLSQPGGSVWIPDSLAGDVLAILDYRLIYKKGASILHILRNEINNDSIFFAVLKQFITENLYSSASVADFRQVAEEVSGNDLGHFFDQWYYGNGYPIFSIHWDQTGETLEIRSEQTTSSSLTPMFNCHFDLRVYSSEGDTTLRLYQSTPLETFSIPLTRPVDSVEFDPCGWLIQQHQIHTSIWKTNEDNPFQVYPNPTTGKVTLLIPQPLAGIQLKVSVYTITGILISEHVINGSESTLDLNGLLPGIYWLHLAGNHGRRMCQVVKL